MSIERLGEIGFVSAETIQADVDRFNEAIRDGRMNRPLGVNLREVDSMTYTEYIAFLSKMNSQWIGDTRTMGRIDEVNLPASTSATTSATTGEATATTEPGS